MRSLTKIISVLCILFFAGNSAFAGQLPTIPGVVSVSVEEVIDLALADNSPKIIDTRITSDFERGHIEGAVSLVDTEMTPDVLAAIVGRDEPVLFYCNGAECERSRNACIKAAQWGWKKIYWFPGGIAEWNQNELPLVK